MLTLRQSDRELLTCALRAPVQSGRDPLAATAAPGILSERAPIWTGDLDSEVRENATLVPISAFSTIFGPHLVYLLTITLRSWYKCIYSPTYEYCYLRACFLD